MDARNLNGAACMQTLVGGVDVHGSGGRQRLLSRVDSATDEESTTLAEPKTRPTRASVDDFINSQTDDQVRDDCRTLVRIMAKATGCEPEMWGTSIVGFGRYWWTGASGKQTEWMLTAFAPRKANLTVYLWPQFDARQTLLARLGKHTSGKGCLYIKRLSDVHVPTLQKLVAESAKHARATTIRGSSLR